jgi:phytoene/squalene synthetase
MNLLQSPASHFPVALQNDEYPTAQARQDLAHAINMVKTYDPAGYLPGRLLPTAQMQWTYYAVRSFWVETGLRIGSTALVPTTASTEEQLEWWENGMEQVFSYDSLEKRVDLKHPTLRLLHQLKYVPSAEDVDPIKKDSSLTLSKCHFDDVLKGRREDLSIKQYATLDQLEEHAVWSCGSLSQLVLEADGIFETLHPLPHQAVKLVGRAHGLTNALRLSIPVVSTTGKLVIPQDLCEKYGVKSPRYLLSALGQGDEKCTRALQLTVEEIVSRARGYLEDARSLRPQLLEMDRNSNGNRRDDLGKHTVAVLLPALTSETFLNRLEAHNFDLTNRNLRNVNMLEHAKCAMNLLRASWQETY